MTKFTNYFQIDQEKVYGKYEVNQGNIMRPILLKLGLAKDLETLTCNLFFLFLGEKKVLPFIYCYNSSGKCGSM